MSVLELPVKVTNSTCSAVGFGVKNDTTTINNIMKTSNHISKISQLVCQNQWVDSQYQPVITFLPEFVMILVSKRTIPIRKPTIKPASPALGVIFLEKIPSTNTATIAGARSD